MHCHFFYCVSFHHLRWCSLYGPPSPPPLITSLLWSEKPARISPSGPQGKGEMCGARGYKSEPSRGRTGTLAMPWLLPLLMSCWYHSHCTPLQLPPQSQDSSAGFTTVNAHQCRCHHSHCSPVLVSPQLLLPSASTTTVTAPQNWCHHSYCNPVLVPSQSLYRSAGATAIQHPLLPP